MARVKAGSGIIGEAWTLNHSGTRWLDKVLDWMPFVLWEWTSDCVSQEVS